MHFQLIKIIAGILLGNAGIRALLIKGTHTVVEEKLNGDDSDEGSPNSGEESVESPKPESNEGEGEMVQTPVKKDVVGKLGKNASIAAVIAAILTAVASYEGTTNFGVQEKVGSELYLKTPTEYTLVNISDVSPGDNLLKITWKDGNTILKLEMLTIGVATPVTEDNIGGIKSRNSTITKVVSQTVPKTPPTNHSPVAAGSNSVANIPLPNPKTENPFQ